MKKNRILKFITIMVLAGFTAGAVAFPLWLKKPERSNPHDPRSTLFVFPTPPAFPTPPPPVFTATSTLTLTPLPGSPTFTPTITLTQTPLSGSGWPKLSDFEMDVATNSAGGTNTAGNDNDDGCGASASTSAIVQQASGSWNASAYMQWDYNVATNAGCTYQYASIGLDMVSQNDVSTYNGVKFYARGSAGGETFKVTLSTTGAFPDSCIPGKNEMTVSVGPLTTGWQLYELAFSNFVDKVGGCPYLPTNATNTHALIMVVDTVSSGQVHIDDIEFATVAVPSPTPSATPMGSNGTWPVLSDFEFNESDNNAGGINGVGTDNDDGCGGPPSASSSAAFRVASGSWNGSAYLQWDYNVATNANCGYEYAAAAMPMVTQTDISAYNTIQFYVRGAAGGETFKINLSTTSAFPDACIPGRNELRYTYSGTTTVWQLVQLPFSAFSDAVGGCPYLPTNATNTHSLNIVVETVSSGTVHFDDIEFINMAPPATSTLTHSPSPTDTPLPGTPTFTNTPVPGSPTDTPTPTPSATPTPLNNGTWPVLSNFTANETANNAGGSNTLGTDNDDGCGGPASTSSSSASHVLGGSWDASNYFQWDYTVGTNATCGYEYAVAAMNMVTEQDISAYNGISFYLRGGVGGESFKIVLTTGAASDPCLPGRNTMAYTVTAVTTSWQLYQIPFAAFVDGNMSCPYLPSNAAQTQGLNLVVDVVSSGQIHMDDVEFIVGAFNGTFPMLSNFDTNVISTTAGGGVGATNDSQDGCGTSSVPFSSASVLQQAAGGKDASPHAEFTFDVRQNTSCSYEYGSMDMALVTVRDVSTYNALRFWVKGDAGGEAFKVKMTTASDPCVPGKNNMYSNQVATAGWVQVTIPFMNFTSGIGACPYVASGNLTRVDWVSFVVDSISAGTLRFDDVEFVTVVLPTPTPTVTPLGSNGVWPQLTTFDFNETGNNDGGVNVAANDNDDGCGPSASSAALAHQLSGGWDAGAYGQLAYNVATNAGCTYEYASFGFPLVSTQDVSAYNAIRFYARDTASNDLLILFSGNASDPCIPGTNRMTYRQLVTTGWVQYTIPFAAFVDNVGGCPYTGNGWLANTAFVSIAIDTVSSGTLDIDDIEFVNVVLPTPTSTTTPTPVPAGWPSLTSFDAGIVANYAGGTNAAGNDNDDGCGASASSSIGAWQSSGSYDDSGYLDWTYNVATNAGCGYEYASYAFPMVTQQSISSMNALRFKASNVLGHTVSIMLQGNAVDGCVGAKNRMTFQQTLQAEWTMYTIPFSAFTDNFGACPYIGGGWLANTEVLVFTFINAGDSYNVRIDDIEFVDTTVPILIDDFSNVNQYVTYSRNDLAGLTTDLGSMGLDDVSAGEMHLFDNGSGVWLSFFGDCFDASAFTGIEFDVRGGTGGETFDIEILHKPNALDCGMGPTGLTVTTLGSSSLATLTTVMQTVQIAFGPNGITAARVEGFRISNIAGPDVYIDNLKFY